MTRPATLLCCLIAIPPVLAFEPPASSRHAVCIAFECEQQAQVTLHADDWRQIRKLFSGDLSPPQERHQIASYIAFMETVSGKQTPTWRDRGRNDPNVEPLGQLDCIAESTNTTTYLALLQSSGLLRHHHVRERQVRNPLWLIPHWTAVIVERDTGEHYAVDSWYQANGRPPAILPLRDWLQGKEAATEFME